MIFNLVCGRFPGADTAALDIALKYGLSRGREPSRKRTHGEPNSLEYARVDAPFANGLQEVERNVRNSDGTVFFTLAKEASGSFLQSRLLAEIHQKPWKHLFRNGSVFQADALRHFVERHRIHTLNVTGSTESEEPGIRDWVMEVLGAALFLEPGE